MALNWDKDISFAGLKRRTPSKNVYPTKTTMNLMVQDKVQVSVQRRAVMGGVAAVVTILILKFGVYDLIAGVTEKTTQLSELQSQVSALEVKMSDYKEVEAEHSSYAGATSAAGVSISTVMDIVDNTVAPVAVVGEVELEENVLTVTIMNPDLNNVGALASALNARDDVQSVAVSTTTSEQGAALDTSAKLAITLVSDKPDESEEDLTEGSGTVMGVDTTGQNLAEGLTGGDD